MDLWIRYFLATDRAAVKIGSLHARLRRHRYNELKESGSRLAWLSILRSLRFLIFGTGTLEGKFDQPLRNRCQFGSIIKLQTTRAPFPLGGRPLPAADGPSSRRCSLLLQRSAKPQHRRRAGGLLRHHLLLRLRVGDEGLEWGEGSTRGGERGRDRGKRKGGTGVRRRDAMSITCSTRTHRHGPGNYVSRTTAVQVEHARMHTRVH